MVGCLDANQSGEEPYDNRKDVEFLENNALREDVKITDSGLQYRVIEEGEGDRQDFF